MDLNKLTAFAQVWAIDITSIPPRKGFLYLVAIVDLFSRYVLSWNISNSLCTEFRLKALRMVLGGCRKAEVLHSDQGCQFTSSVFGSRVEDLAIRISWTGKNDCYDNILLERLLRPVKYEEVFLHAYSDAGRSRSACPTSYGGIPM